MGQRAWGREHGAWGMENGDGKPEAEIRRDARLASGLHGAWSREQRAWSMENGKRRPDEGKWSMDPAHAFGNE